MDIGWKDKENGEKGGKKESRTTALNIRKEKRLVTVQIKRNNWKGGCEDESESTDIDENTLRKEGKNEIN